MRCVGLKPAVISQRCCSATCMSVCLSVRPSVTINYSRRSSRVVTLSSVSRRSVGQADETDNILRTTSQSQLAKVIDLAGGPPVGLLSGLADRALSMVSGQLMTLSALTAGYSASDQPMTNELTVNRTDHWSVLSVRECFTSMFSSSSHVRIILSLLVPLPFITSPP